MLALLESVIDRPSIWLDLQILVARLLAVEGLWKKIDSAEENLSEIETGRESTKTVVNAGETLNLMSQIMSSSCNEINFIFPTPNVAKRFMLEGLFGSATYSVKNRIQLRILIKENRSSIDSCLVEKLPFAVGKMIGTSRCHIELRYVRNLQTQTITVIVDSEKLLSRELKDSSQGGLLNSIGSAIFSDNPAIVTSHLAVFETWWLRSQLGSNL